MERRFISINNPDFRDCIKWLMVKMFNIDESVVSDILKVKDRFDLFIKHLDENLMVFIEPVYVDKVYRDSYYSYYASKATNVSRNCIRLSFFEDKAGIIKEDVMDYSQYEYLKNSYRGFVVIRPTITNIIGRNALSPLAVKNNEFQICKTEICSTADGFKFKVGAFPAASQDTETMSCAETTVWAMMEYFGNKYPEYTPLLPSTIIGILKQTTYERQLPSRGLTEDNLSYIAKSCGFGSQLYHRDCFPNFYNILSCYIESGIPIMIAISNLQHIADKIEAGKKDTEIAPYLGHAVLCIGHENITKEHIDKTTTVALNNGIKLLDYDDVEKKFVFIDDNFPPYQLDSLSKPTERYNIFSSSGQDWEHCKIDHFVAPLYHKVYLEPIVVKGYLKNLIQSSFMKQLHNSEITMRVFLCSTRSYRDYVNQSNMSEQMKRVISSIVMPKFIWVAELSDKENLKQNIATGIILIDATECKTQYHKALLVSLCGGEILLKDNSKLTRGFISMNSFKMYNNLN